MFTKDESKVSISGNTVHKFVANEFGGLVFSFNKTFLKVALESLKFFI